MLALADHGTKDFGFKQKGRSIGPVAGRDGENAAALAGDIRFDAGEWTRPGDAGGARTTELISGAGVEAGRSGCGFPHAIRRAGVLAFAGYVTLILHFENFDCAADIEIGGRLDGVADANAGNFDLRSILGRQLYGNGRQMDDVEFIDDVVIEIQRAVARIAEMNHNRVSVANGFLQMQDEHSGGLGGRICNRQIVGGNGDAADGQLLFGIGVVHQHGAAKSDGLLDAPANHGQGRRPEQNRDDQGNPDFDFMCPSHG